VSAAGARWPRCPICGETRNHRHSCNDSWHTPPMWVARDGSWGSGEVVVIPTKGWTTEEVDAANARLDEAADSDRMKVAMAIAAEREGRRSTRPGRPGQEHCVVPCDETCPAGRS